MKCSLSCFLKALVEFVMLGTHALTIARLIHLFLRTSQLVGFVTVQKAFNRPVTSTMGSFFPINVVVVVAAV